MAQEPYGYGNQDEAHGPRKLRSVTPRTVALDRVEQKYPTRFSNQAPGHEARMKMYTRRAGLKAPMFQPGDEELWK